MDDIRVTTQQHPKPRKCHDRVVPPVFVDFVAFDLFLATERLVDEVELRVGREDGGESGKRGGVECSFVCGLCIKVKCTNQRE